MHELSICRSILSQVEDIAKQRDAHSVTVVHLQVGALSGVEISLLQSSWGIASADTIASSAELDIEEMPIIIQCDSCDRQSEATTSKLVCGHCGEWRTKLISGDEMLLRSIELER